MQAVATNPGYIYKTKTKDVAGLVRAKSIGEKALAKTALQAGRLNLFDMKDTETCTRFRLYLYLHALDSWAYCESSPDTEVYNFMTEDDLNGILSQIGQLITLCCDTCETF